VGRSIVRAATCLEWMLLDTAPDRKFGPVNTMAKNCLWSPYFIVVRLQTLAWHSVESERRVGRVLSFALPMAALSVAHASVTPSGPCGRSRPAGVDVENLLGPGLSGGKEDSRGLL